MKEGESAVRMVVEWWGMDKYWQSYGHFGGIWEKKKKDASDRKKKCVARWQFGRHEAEEVDLIHVLGVK
jgi:hypothetical protein